MAYADITICDRNPVKRWLQRRRFSDALTVLRDAPPSSDRVRILDFGAGDGELIRQMSGIASIEAWVYEPNPSLMAEARVKLSRMGWVVFTDSLGSVEPGIFDYVFCLEVFEHLPQEETLAAITDMHRLLKPGGAVVIGVPHELFIPALIKGLFRMSRRYGDFDAKPGNILGAIFGRPPISRPTSQISRGLPYHFHHLGFDFRALRKTLQKRFNVTKTWFSPVPALGAVLNSEVYFLLKKAQPRAAERTRSVPN